MSFNCEIDLSINPSSIFNDQVNIVSISLDLIKSKTRRRNNRIGQVQIWRFCIRFVESEGCSVLSSIDFKDLLIYSFHEHFWNSNRTNVRLCCECCYNRTYNLCAATNRNIDEINKVLRSSDFLIYMKVPRSSDSKISSWSMISPKCCIFCHARVILWRNFCAKRECKSLFRSDQIISASYYKEFLSWFLV